LTASCSTFGKKTLNRPKIAVSSCLLGHEVRFDGGHKNSRYVSDILSEYFDFVPLCPEVAIGLGVPRPTIRLVETAPNVIDAVSNADSSLVYSRELREYGRKTAPQLNNISGYIFKKDSPSCGMSRVKIYRGAQKMPERVGVGLYADEIMKALPNLPMEEEGRLQDTRLRENFLERVFLYSRWQAFRDRGYTSRGLVEFHTAQKFAVLAHDETVYRELGRIVAKAGEGDISEACEAYIALLMKGMSVLTTPKKHANVLMHIMGFFKESLSAEDKAELLRLIDAHREGLVPVIVPITLINYFRKKYPNEYIDGQTYLEPHPPELMLRNAL
jgi:uncharacterized protein YbgA (DUF1722 family)/uncharacterized protein YbbK (DUF523 family)